jgi:AcrR family transcriptional regulator
MRLIEAAETLFIRKGFDDTSVDEISEVAGYSRGAFYSNFNDKNQLFLAVIDRRRPSVPKALDDIFQRILEPGSRTAAVRDWYSSQWRLKDFIALQMDLSRLAMKDRSIRVTTAVVRYFGAAEVVRPERPEIVAIVLLAVARGLASLAADNEPEREPMYTEAAALVFDRMTAPKISQLGELQC